MSQPLLKLSNLEKTFEVQCDAAGDSVNAVLSQEGQQIAYERFHLHLEERTLGIYKELLL